MTAIDGKHAAIIVQFATSFCTLLIIHNLGMVEAAGVELSGVLITRKLLIPGMATTAKKAPLPDPLYVHCAKLFCTGIPQTSHSGHRYPLILHSSPTGGFQDRSVREGDRP